MKIEVPNIKFSSQLCFYKWPQFTQVVGIVVVSIKVGIVVVGIIFTFLSGLLFFEVGIAPVGIVGQPVNNCWPANKGIPQKLRGKHILSLVLDLKWRLSTKSKYLRHTTPRGKDVQTQAWSHLSFSHNNYIKSYL